MLITSQHVNAISFLKLVPLLFGLGLKISLCLLMCAILVLWLVSVWSLTQSSHLGLHIAIRFVRLDIYHTGDPTMTHLQAIHLV